MGIRDFANTNRQCRFVRFRSAAAAQYTLRNGWMDGGGGREAAATAAAVGKEKFVMGGCGGEQGWENRFSFFHAEMRDNMSPIFQSLSRLWLMQINYNFLIHINSQIVDAMRFSCHGLMIVLIITGRRFSCGWEGGLSNNRWWDAKWRAYNRLNRINQCRMPQQIFDINNSIHFFLLLLLCPFQLLFLLSQLFVPSLARCCFGLTAEGIHTTYVWREWMRRVGGCESKKGVIKLSRRYGMVCGANWGSIIIANWMVSCSAAAAAATV